MSDPVLDVKNLSVSIRGDKETITPVNDVSFSVAENEVLAIVGESGSGKTMTSLSIMGLLPGTNSKISSGSISLLGQELVGAENDELRQLRGRKMAMVFQDPLSSLNPVMKVGDQIAEAITVHARVGKKEARNRVAQVLEDVGIAEPLKRMKSYPHELSGGMRQRVMIAMALVNDPALIIADEPTTALDVTVQAQVLELLSTIQKRTNCAIILITHDLGVVAGLAQKVMVMYGGRAIEKGSVDDIFYRPAHPYTKGLLAALPQVDVSSDRLQPIPGQPPSMARLPSGCAFHPRCPMAQLPTPCSEQVPLLREIGAEHASACHFAEQVLASANE